MVSKETMTNSSSGKPEKLFSGMEVPKKQVKPKPYRPSGKAIVPVPLKLDLQTAPADKSISKKQQREMVRNESVQVLRELKLVKDVFAETFMDLQHMSKFNLKVWAMKNPTEFYRIAAKLIPVQLTGEAGGPIELKNVTFE